MSRQVSFSDFPHWIDFQQISFFVSVFTILFAVVVWNILGRLEYHFRIFTRLFGSKFRGCYVIALYIFCFSFYRNLAFNWAINDQPKFEITNIYLDYFLDFISLSLNIGGIVFVFTSSWALGILGTYNGDYFRILMEERITQFPFSILSNPMYVGSTMLFFGRAIWQTSPAGILLSIWVSLIYRLGTLFEEPFTAYIYSQDETKRKKKNKNNQKSLRIRNFKKIFKNGPLKKLLIGWKLKDLVNIKKHFYVIMLMVVLLFV